MSSRVICIGAYVPNRVQALLTCHSGNYDIATAFQCVLDVLQGGQLTRAPQMACPRKDPSSWQCKIVTRTSPPLHVLATCQMHELLIVEGSRPNPNISSMYVNCNRAYNDKKIDLRPLLSRSKVRTMSFSARDGCSGQENQEVFLRLIR